MPSRPKEKSPQSVPVAERVQAILASKGLSLYRVSQRSAALYGRSSPYFVPHSLYYGLRRDRFRPSVHQIFSLSRLTGYCFRDWLRVFDFDLENITRLQALLPSKRTILLDTSLTSGTEWTPWVRNRAWRGPIPTIAPLGQLLALTAPQQISSLPKSKRRFLYAKVGREDALAFPDLIPGSIVRVDPDIHANSLRQHNSTMPDPVFLLEHSRGFFCCRLRFLSNGVIVPLDPQLCYAQVELRCPEQARILGAVDFEFSPLLETMEPHVPPDLARRWKPQALPKQQTFGQLLQTNRRRLHVSIREAASRSRNVAELLKDSGYAISSSSLSDYEVHNTAPRDFRKIISLCSIYGLRFEGLMSAMTLEVSDLGSEPIPDRYLFARRSSRPALPMSDMSSGFLQQLLNECQNEIPFFLRDLLGYFSGSARLSLDDFFWIGGDQDPLHPYLASSLIVVLNRRRKTPVHSASKSIWQQAIYMILRREGSYLAASCGIENNNLVVHPYATDFHPSIEYRLHRDAEIVGQIVAIARRFP